MFILGFIVGSIAGFMAGIWRVELIAKVKELIGKIGNGNK